MAGLSKKMKLAVTQIHRHMHKHCERTAKSVQEHMAKEERKESRKAKVKEDLNKDDAITNIRKNIDNWQDMIDEVNLDHKLDFKKKIELLSSLTDKQDKANERLIELLSKHKKDNATEFILTELKIFVVDNKNNETPIEQYQ
jgi:uncharacterized membrane protein YhiD involved in acid resistance